MKQFFKQHNVAALKCDKGKTPDVFKSELAALGYGDAPPVYAIYGPGVEAPITFSGPITTGGIMKAIEGLLQNSPPSQIIRTAVQK